MYWELVLIQLNPYFPKVLSNLLGKVTIESCLFHHDVMFIYLLREEMIAHAVGRLRTMLVVSNIHMFFF